MGYIKMNVTGNQEAFDRVVRHLASMRRQAMVENPREMFRATHPEVCIYESEDGKARCAIGALLVLDTPEKHAWAKSAFGEVADFYSGADYEPHNGSNPPKFLIDATNFTLDFLEGLQQLHDDSSHWGPDGFENWEAVEVFASQHRLETEVLRACRTD